MDRTTLWLDPWLWVAIGFLGQALFMSRMLVQWIVAEHRGDSVVPVAFWWLSLAGGLITLAYAIYNRDPVIAFAQTLGSFVYARNLALIRRSRRTVVMNLEFRGPHRAEVRDGGLCADRAA
ncbi:MAG: lipid-A-disaccharide synthase N-terminal domain-containing protein [Solirubrobacterales bacterium]|nr:lipid-A-disaccharide synthase N-terminal domain-containing protein [Solirubrobacterales bacterium]